MKRNSKYWEKRAAKRMEGYMLSADKTAAKISAAYKAAMADIDSQLGSIFRNFSADISAAEAKRILNTVKSDDMIKRLKKAVDSVSDPEQKALILAEINAPAYRYRIQRLQRLSEDIRSKCEEIAGESVSQTGSLLRSLVKESYDRTMFDIQKGAGYGFSFDKVSKAQIMEILQTNWSGKHYSKRIWGNTNKLAAELEDMLLSGFMTGKSSARMSADIAERMGASFSRAYTLVRTESNYVTNQAEKLSYQQCGIETYRYLATLDGRTSEICAALDGKEFPLENARVGENYPPMHPRCRSTTISAPDKETLAKMKRRARDPETGETQLIPGDMTYEEWRRKYVDKSAESDIIEPSKEYTQVIDQLKALKINKLPAKLFDNIPSEDEIINRLSGGDMTKGSCASLTFAYAGNKGGVDVLDFRGGKSCEFFSMTSNIKDIAKLKGVNAEIVKNTDDFLAVTELLRSVDPQKEYVLVTGKHAAIIRKTENGFEYLEMQGSKNNGFKQLTTTVLKKRFGCKKTHKSYGYSMQSTSLLIDRESLSTSDEFKNLLSYINTSRSQQKKGASGYAK